MRLELSRRAQADLDDIRSFSVKHFGAARTIAYLDTIEQTFRRIVRFPEIGAVDDRINPPIRSLPCGSHRIYYDLEAGRLIVRRVLHQAMDAKQHL